MKLPTAGFWFDELAPNSYPRPQRLVGAWDPHARAAVAAYLARGQTFASFLGYSYCRFSCGVASRAMGARDFTDGTFVWPEALAHYVECHDVRLPDDLVSHALADRPHRAWPKDGLLDDAPWLAWARAQGACLDLTGWEVPGWEDQNKIRALLDDDDDVQVVLARADTRHVVIARPGGALEIRQLTADPEPPRVLSGWDAWPILR